LQFSLSEGFKPQIVEEDLISFFNPKTLEVQGLQRDSTRLGSYTCPDPCKVLLAVHD
jgi:hypothetical protein